MKKESLFMRFYYNFSIFNIDLVNAKSGRILSSLDKAINISVNIFASLLSYLIILGVIFLFLFL